MSEPTYDAFSALTKRQTNKPHRIRPITRVEAHDDGPVLILAVPISEIAHAKPGSGQRRSVGFALGPVEFTVPEGNGTTAGTYQLYASWVSLTAR